MGHGERFDMGWSSMWSPGFRLGCLARNPEEGAGRERGGKRMGCVSGLCERR